MFTDVERLMDGQLADMAFCDAPYNVDYANASKNKALSKDRRILNDALGDGFYQFLYDTCVNLLMVTKGACYMSMSSSELDTLQRAFKAAGGKWSTFIIWAKNTFTLGRADYQRQYEPILYGWKQGTDHFWCGDRDQSDIWNYNKPRVNDLHPTMKPVELVERAIKNSSKSRDIVLDLFGGSGTTLIASEKTGRHARLIELDPKFVDVIIKRWEDYTVAKEVMLERTHIPEAPWWVVQAVDKKKARLNCIHHLLRQIPYGEIEHPAIVLPPRERHGDYVRHPIPEHIMVPEVY